MPSPRASEARPRSIAAAISGVISSSSTEARDSESREWAGHHLEQMDDRGKLSRIELIEEMMRVLFVSCCLFPSHLTRTDPLNNSVGVPEVSGHPHDAWEPVEP